MTKANIWRIVFKVKMNLFLLTYEHKYIRWIIRPLTLAIDWAEVMAWKAYLHAKN